MPKDFMRGGAFSNINIAAIEKDNGIGASTTVWTTEKINKLLDDYADGSVDIRGYKGSPFLNNDVNLRKPKLQFQYTKDEMREWRRCAKDPIYFAKNFCKLFTEDGYINVNLRDYQRELINGFLDNRFSILMAARQVGKCFIFSTLMKIYDKRTGETCDIPFYELWYGILRKNKMVNVYSWLKYRLYKIYDKLTRVAC